MRSELFLISALALPFLSSKKPIIKETPVVSTELRKWQLPTKDITRHERSSLYILKDEELAVNRYEMMNFLKGHPHALPFQAESFFMVVDITMNFYPSMIKEITRVLEWRGYLYTLKEIDELLKQYPYIKMRYMKGAFFVYQKGRERRKNWPNYKGFFGLRRSA